MNLQVHIWGVLCIVLLGAAFGYLMAESRWKRRAWIEYERGWAQGHAAARRRSA